MLFFKQLYHKHYKTFGRFALVGGANTIIDFAVFIMLLNYFEAHYILAHIAGFFIAFLNSYYWNRNWTFKQHRSDVLHKEMVLFFFTNVAALCLSTVVLYLVNLYFPVLVGKVCAVFSSFMWNYLISHSVVFKARK